MIIFFNNHNNRCTSGEEEVKRVCKSTRRRKKSVKSSTFIRHFIIPTYQAYSIRLSTVYITCVSGDVKKNKKLHHLTRYGNFKLYQIILVILDDSFI